MRSIKGNMDKSREAKEHDAEDRFGATVADELRQLSAREKAMAKK